MSREQISEMICELELSYCYRLSHNLSNDINSLCMVEIKKIV